jgi:hypothetical protein
VAALARKSIAAIEIHERRFYPEWIAFAPVQQTSPKDTMQTESISRPRRDNVAGFEIPLVVTRNADGHLVHRSMTLLVERSVAATRESPPLTDSLLQAVSALINAVNCALSGKSNHARQYLSAACHSLESEPTGLDRPAVLQPRVPLSICH